ncbi:hypothetical protein [Parachryseolinea silvisoli]|uniref:hypothetical protein n=1 Tax=Parachryseolinea silvisoli TaxID=2873601 RepID=UPI002265A33F|nr:hypothetical protein [Parachryseolinea silvisoli]MCD9018777.1 hypothetical protein [Parachryseolinea silvisoli]
MKKLFWITLFCIGACGYDHDSAPSTIDLQWDEEETYRADGNTTIEITVSLPEDAASGFRLVTLSTKAGKFQNGDTTMVMDLRLENSSTTLLKVGSRPGVFEVYGGAGGYKISKLLTLEKLPDAAAIKSVELLGFTGMVADGTSEGTINVSMGLNEPLVFATEHATLREFGGPDLSRVTIDPVGTGEVTAIFTAGRAPGLYRVSIATADRSYDTLVSFTLTAAYAEQIVLDLPQVTVDSTGGQMPVTAMLDRSIGLVTPQTPVIFTASAGNLTPASVYTTAESATVETQFVYNEGSLHVGDVITITASTPKGDGTYYTATRTLIVE